MLFLKRTVYLKGRVMAGERKREKERKTLLSTGSLPQMSAASRLGQAVAGSPELHSGLPRGWQGPTCLNHPVLPLRVHMDRKLDSEAEPDTHPGTPILDSGDPPVGASGAGPNTCTGI